ncbi:hypothetical protein V7S57_05560 [Caulobacter sp. CCNWLY153]|jgi:hypothetical protein|uniref:Uncharacterized protein n=1 Tax=Caulobacter radicis TaxID=2172650 RepID=A0A2T9J1Y8_9CAUL|nr:hypothetical protein [Caulobacter radicis]PVM74099.1 hypothetical protein DDF65_21090 [Caulobacter radicis]
MSRDYLGDRGFTVEQLALWIDQVEDLTGRIVALQVKPGDNATRGSFDIYASKPATKVKILMGHLPAPGGIAFQGRAYILGQVMDVTLYRG